MRFKFSTLTNEDKVMNGRINFQPNNAADAIAAARTTVEREFSALIELQPRLFHLALNEAEALAWESGFPELTFPLLAQEKAKNVLSWYERQQFVRQNGPINGPMQAFAA